MDFQVRRAPARRTYDGLPSPSSPCTTHVRWTSKSVEPPHDARTMDFQVRRAPARRMYDGLPSPSSPCDGLASRPQRPPNRTSPLLGFPIVLLSPSSIAASFRRGPFPLAEPCVDRDELGDPTVGPHFQVGHPQLCCVFCESRRDSPTVRTPHAIAHSNDSSPRRSRRTRSPSYRSAARTLRSRLRRQERRSCD